MKTSRRANKTAGSGDQSFPSAPTSPSLALALHDVPFNVGSGPAAVDPDALSCFQRLLLVISHQAMEARRLRTVRAEVVLKADADTDLILHIRANGEIVEVTGKVQCGNFAAIQGHWPQLQQVLSSQQIHLASLRKPHQKGHSPISQPALPLAQQTDPESLDELYCVGSLTEPLRWRALKHAPIK